jgi:hypothetical protein
VAGLIEQHGQRATRAGKPSRHGGASQEQRLALRYVPALPHLGLQPQALVNVAEF